MDSEEWSDICKDVVEYLEVATDLPEPVEKVVRMNLGIGNAEPTERETAVLSIKALLKGREGTPFRKGHKASVPASVRVAIDRLVNHYDGALRAYYGHHPVIQFITFRHGKSGGGCFNSEKEYLLAEKKKLRTKLANMYKAGNWDGTYEHFALSEEE